jgi:hypothetical protein
MPWPRLSLALALWIAPGAIAVALAQPATVLYRFSGGSDGANPQGPLVADRAGNLYGAAQSGGLGFGVIFELSPPSSPGGRWTESVLYRFKNEADGSAPVGGLARDAAGNLYGVTTGGGVVFRLTRATPARSWTFSTLYAFGATAALPNALVLDAAGRLYGTTNYGGAFQYAPGLAYQLSPTADGTVPWTLSVLHEFAGYPTDGAYPSGALTVGSAGVVYGTTSEGGSGECFDAGTFIGCGTVFAISSSTTGWTETPIYSFTSRESNAPYYAVTLGAGGSLYGTAGYDVFRLSPASDGSWHKRTLYQFTAGISGTMPDGALLVGGSGALYGTSSSSGLSGFSTAFRVAPPLAPGPWLETTLGSFSTGFTGAQPTGGLVVGSGRRLYGVTAATPDGDFGTIFSVLP